MLSPVLAVSPVSESASFHKFPRRAWAFSPAPVPERLPAMTCACFSYILSCMDILRYIRPRMKTENISLFFMSLPRIFFLCNNSFSPNKSYLIYLIFRWVVWWLWVGDPKSGYTVRCLLSELISWHVPQSIDMPCGLIVNVLVWKLETWTDTG
jgi:hypothetical protein